MRAAVLIATLAACSGGEPAKPQSPPALPVELVSLQPTKVVDSTEYLATLRPLTAIALQPQIEGHVTEIRVHAGETVTAGQVLMRIDPGPQPAAVVRAQASRASRQASLELAERNLGRVRELVTKGALAEQELDNAEAAVATARNDVAALGAEITSSAAQLRYFQITAPSAGVVGDIPVRVGDLVTPQTRLTSVTDNTTLEANIAVPVERAGQIKPGTHVQLVDDQSHVVAQGDVSFISPQVNPDTQSVLVKAIVQNADGVLRAEQLTRARVVWQTRDGLTVPALAVTRLGGQAFAYVAMPSGTGLVAHQRPVELGELTDNAYVVEHGLAPGDKIIVSQVQKLRDGAPVMQLPPGMQKPGAGPANPPAKG